MPPGLFERVLQRGYRQNIHGLLLAYMAVLADAADVTPYVLLVSRSTAICSICAVCCRKLT
jgi:hypothetical protein